VIKMNTVAEVYQTAPDADDWVVWAADPDPTSAAMVAIFSGPEAEARALEYAAMKFGGFRHHAAPQRPQLHYQNPIDPGVRTPGAAPHLRLVD
jgi:hypothetical protein